MHPDAPHLANPIRGLSRYRIIVRRLGREPKPYGWEIHDDEGDLRVTRSEDRYRSFQDAWEAGTKVLHRQNWKGAAGQPRRTPTTMIAQHPTTTIRA